MKYKFFLACMIIAAQALPVSTLKAATVSAKPSAVDAQTPQVTVVTGAAPGQTGYVHYYLITHGDGSLEYHVGIELDDQRIAWSFPEAGVSVVAFEKQARYEYNGKNFKVDHLYGLRPFASDAGMRLLRSNLTTRVARWIDDETPYCLSRAPGAPFCLSCGDFAVRILYPGPTPISAALPRDAKGGALSFRNTDDLLLYLVGLQELPDQPAQLARLNALDLPHNMRTDIIAMLAESEPAALVTTSPAGAATSILKPETRAPAKGKVSARRPRATPVGIGRGG